MLLLPTKLVGLHCVIRHRTLLVYLAQEVAQKLFVLSFICLRLLWLDRLAQICRFVECALGVCVHIILGHLGSLESVQIRLVEVRVKACAVLVHRVRVCHFQMSVEGLTATLLLNPMIGPDT